MVDFKLGMYSRLKFSKSKKALIRLMFFENAKSNNLMTALGSRFHIYLDMI